MNPLGYRQCRLQKKTESGHRETVSWLPSMYAQVGRVLKLKNAQGEWEDGWVVVTASSEVTRLPDLYDGRDPRKLFPSLKDEKKRRRR